MRVSVAYLKDFDLAAGGVEVLGVFSSFVLLKSVNLNTERDTLFSSMLAHSKLCADTVNLKQAEK